MHSGGHAATASHRASVSALVGSLAGTWSRERVTIGDLLAALGDRGYGLLMLVLAMPNLIPLPLIGLSAIFGIPLGALAIQMLVGLPQPWLPRVLADRSLARRDLTSMFARSVPHLRLAERILCPRFPALTARSMERLIGAVCLVLAVLLSLPIPFTGIPLALPVIVLSLGIIERDGAFVIFGLAGAAVAATYAFIVAKTAILAMFFVAGSALGF